MNKKQLEALDIEELRDMCYQRKIPYMKRTTKEQFIALISTHDELHTKKVK